ncbi:MAG: hypothetical protein A2Z75_08820 [Chloroflexi bacterium RBG_13_50_10]|nr:MAG: hypothetical protein A2Z75_08820 [Chloroflexi bacterium RBG_13_50_10]
MKIKWYLIITVVLLLLSLTACSQRKGQAEQEFFDLCDKMNKHIEQAQAIASDLENFNWNEFSDIGILCPPAGICPVGNLPIVEKKSVVTELMDRWVPLVERLPSPQTAKSYSIQCNNCLNLAREVCSQSPYNESQAPQEPGKLITQWQELCVRLQSALQGTAYLASRDKTIAADYTFPQLFAYLTTSDEKVKQKYLAKFMAKSDEYIQLHDELTHDMQQAEQIAIELADWPFNTQGPEEQ